MQLTPPVAGGRLDGQILDPAERARRVRIREKPAAAFLAVGEHQQLDLVPLRELPAEVEQARRAWHSGRGRHLPGEYEDLHARGIHWVARITS